MMRTRTFCTGATRGLGIAALLVGLIGPATAGDGLNRKPSPPGAAVYFIGPENGATIEGAVTVRFGLRGMGVAPAGIDKAATGHHHVLVDTDLPALGRPIPNDENHRHFGGGQTEASLALPPGEHTLQLILGDDRHIPHDPAVLSERITVTVR